MKIDTTEISPFTGEKSVVIEESKLEFVEKPVLQQILNIK